jgi:hypothetical protein
MPSYANNDGWFDDISDGPVTATIVFAGGQTVTVGPDGGGAWLLVAPPDFAPGVPGSVTGYDLLFDMAVRSNLPIGSNAMYAAGGPLAKSRAEGRLREPHLRSGKVTKIFPTVQPSFVDDIRPILLAAYHLWWVDGLVTSKHNSLIDPKLGSTSAANASVRGARPCARPTASCSRRRRGSMPKTLGDDPYTSTS